MKFEKNKWVNLTGTSKQTNIGRFAPSPTGPLHVGSLFTALASFLDARAHQGKWLLRIDDLDEPRNVAGASDNILRTLEKFGLLWDETETFQSRCVSIYQEYLNVLAANDLLFRCFCSRKTLADSAALDSAGIYPGFCRNKEFCSDEPYALRVKTDQRNIYFQDRLQGSIGENLARQHGDFIVRRKDQIIAYQFAVVIDDFLQHITHVVRGTDLLNSTAKQIYLQQLLGFTAPDYMHVPVIIDHLGYKLSKQTLAAAVDCGNPSPVLFDLLTLLQQNPPTELTEAPVDEILGWAVKNWQPSPLKGVRSVRQNTIDY